MNHAKSVSSKMMRPIGYQCFRYRFASSSTHDKKAAFISKSLTLSKEHPILFTVGASFAGLMIARAYYSYWNHTAIDNNRQALTNNWNALANIQESVHNLRVGLANTQESVHNLRVGLGNTQNSLEAQIKEKSLESDKKFAVVHEKIDAVDKKVDALENTLAVKFDEMSGKLDHVLKLVKAQ